jgi:hypothetical protein
MEFIELPNFTRSIEAMGAEEAYRKLQLELIANPEKGDLIQGTGGFRKVRMALKDRGKSGSTRVIYLYFLSAQIIVLGMIYKKSDRDTLSHDQKKSLRAIADQLKDQL